MSERSSPSDVTLFVGAPTRFGRAVNDFVRLNGTALRESDVFAVANKNAIHALRTAIGDNPDRSDIDALLAAASDRPVLLSALFALGRPATVVRDNVFFPNAEPMLESIAEVLTGGVRRVVLAVEPVHHLLLSVGRRLLVSDEPQR